MRCDHFGTGERPDKAVNVGVAAYITAASIGGPRYDASLSKAERAAAENGIWLCQTHAKLVDNDPIRFNTGVLRQWKDEAEARRRQMLSSGSGFSDMALDLSIPSLHDPEALLSFASTRLSFISRGNELDDLKAFLEADADFAWWLVTGPGGIGKSRLGDGA